MNPSTLLNRQPPHIKAELAEMARTHTYPEIVNWLNDRGVRATYNQVKYHIRANCIGNRLREIKPVTGHAAKVRVYVTALMNHGTRTYTINNLRLHGSSWTGVSAALRRDGLTEAMRNYSPMRWRILATKDELREWMEREVSK